MARKTIIVINCHIILMENVVFKLPEGNKLQSVRIFYKNEKQDLFLLEIPNENFIAVKMGPSTDVHIGEEVYAIGNPQGTEKSLS